jgi:hypothetical protein
MLIIYFHTRFYILSSSGSLVTAVKLKVNETFSLSHHVVVRKISIKNTAHSFGIYYGISCQEILSCATSVVPTQTGTYSLLLLPIKEKEYDVEVPFNGKMFTLKLLKN